MVRQGQGFGFANTFGRDEDVFVHIEVLRRSGLADLQPGEALAMRVIDGKRGRMATEVFGWESAVKQCKADLSVLLVVLALPALAVVLPR